MVLIRWLRPILGVAAVLFAAIQTALMLLLDSEHLLANNNKKGKHSMLLSSPTLSLLPRRRIEGSRTNSMKERDAASSGRQNENRHQQLQPHRLNEVSRFHPSDAFGGCLMLMDDNHFLVEWLAYHWFVLPLRHLTVLVDEKSRTSPFEIFDRWKDYMTIEVVSNWTYPGVLALPTPMVHANETAVRHYLGRQHSFYTDCMKRYKLHHDWKSWVILTDTDEFLSINKFARLPSHPLYAGDNVHLPANKVSGSVMKRIKQIRRRQEHSQGAENVTDCLITPRTQICLKTLDDLPRTPPYLQALGLKDGNFLTQHFVLGDKRKNGKGMIDVGAIDSGYFEQLNLLTQGGSAHVIAPGRETCKQQLDFQIYHYAGTEEQRTFRDNVDPRGVYSNRVGGSVNPEEDECLGKRASDLKPWLRGFVAKVGQAEAKRLLDGVGRVRGWPPYVPTTDLSAS